jgi:hypothetical protein
MDFRVTLCEGLDWVLLVWNRDHCRVEVNNVMNNRASNIA